MGLSRIPSDVDTIDKRVELLTIDIRIVIMRLFHVGRGELIIISCCTNLR